MSTISKINLLPWRDELRAEKQKEFYILLLLAALVGGVLWWLWQGHIQSQIDHQNARNTKIERKIGELNKRISEIKDIEKRRGELVERMRVIQDLQGNRPSVVYVFDELAQMVPKGVHYTDIRRVKDKFTIKGVAETNNYVSALMRQMSASDWFDKPTLESVSTMKDNRRSFSLTVKQKSPDIEGDDK